MTIFSSLNNIKDEQNLFIEKIHTFSSTLLRHIQAICDLRASTAEVNFLYLCIQNNLKNAKHLLTVSNVRHCWIENLNTLEKLALNKIRTLDSNISEISGITMNPSTSSSTSISSVARQRIREELKKISETRVKPEDVRKLREEIVPPGAPLDIQKTIATQKADEKESFLGVRLGSMDTLQNTIKDLEDKVSQLMEESTKAQLELKKRRANLLDGLVELLRLHKLIEQIEKEISEKTSGFQKQLEDMEQRRLEILNDPNLTEEERTKFLKELDNDMKTLKDGHTTELRLLEHRRDELQNESRAQAQALEGVVGDLKTHHLQELEELESRKIGASPSEILRFEEEIRQKQQKFDENMNFISKKAEQKQYLYDKNGRYYINEHGIKVYKKDSFASEYTINPDGTLQKITDALNKQFDEYGEFHIDKFGNKIYTKKFYADDKGQYFVDKDGNRMYVEDSLGQFLDENSTSSSSIFLSPEGNINSLEAQIKDIYYS